MLELLKRQNWKPGGERRWIAGVLLVVGLFIAWHATNYELGSLRRMGPGYFPMMLGLATSLLACLILISPDLEDHDGEFDGAGEEGSGRSLMRTLGFVLGAIVTFLVLVRPAGFVPAVALTTFMAGLAEPKNRVVDLCLLSIGVTVVTSLVFVVGLGIPVQLVAF
ncbi:MAG: tripartite tricarboxylate transporter TctB family protein [Pseudomonadota bacterium]